MLQEKRTTGQRGREAGPIRIRGRGLGAHGPAGDRGDPDRTHLGSLAGRGQAGALTGTILGPLLHDLVLSLQDLATGLAASLSRSLGDRLLGRDRLESLVHETGVPALDMGQSPPRTYCI